MATILISAGDASGDLHAAELVRVLRARHPEYRWVGLGGPAMEASGVDLRVPGDALAVGGIFEVLGSLAGVVRTARALEKVVREEVPDLIVLVDSGGFHLPLGRRLRKSQAAPILYYIPPQVWAWRPRRLKKLAALADRIAVILPFEKDSYRQRGVEVDYVGHPLLDRWSPGGGEREGEGGVELSRARARTRISTLATDGRSERPLLGLFPGSRRGELDRHLPLQLETFRLLAQERPELEAVLAVAPGVDAERIEARIAEGPADLRPKIHLVTGSSREAIEAVDVALAKPGTITLELLLANRPMVVMGRAHPLTARIVQRSLRVPFMAMPNLLAGASIVPERLQGDARPEVLAGLLRPLFEGPERTRQLASFNAVRERLGPPGAARRTAQIVEEMLGDPET